MENSKMYKIPALLKIFSYSFPYSTYILSLYEYPLNIRNNSNSSFLSILYFR